MKKVTLILIGILLCGSAYAEMSDKQFIQKVKSIYEDRRELNELSKQRQAEEQALIVEYKVDECNQKRNEIMNRYQALMQEVINRSRGTEEYLGEK